MMFRNLLFAAMALVVLAFGLEPTYDTPKQLRSTPPRRHLPLSPAPAVSCRA